MIIFSGEIPDKAKNMLGDICAIYSSSGELVCRYVYDAWGKER